MVSLTPSAFPLISSNVARYSFHSVYVVWCRATAYSLLLHLTAVKPRAFEGLSPNLPTVDRGKSDKLKCVLKLWKKRQRHQRRSCLQRDSSPLQYFSWKYGDSRVISVRRLESTCTSIFFLFLVLFFHDHFLPAQETSRRKLNQRPKRGRFSADSFLKSMRAIKPRYVWL